MVKCNIVLISRSLTIIFTRKFSTVFIFTRTMRAKINPPKNLPLGNFEHQRLTSFLAHSVMDSAEPMQIFV